MINGNVHDIYQIYNHIKNHQTKYYSNESENVVQIVGSTLSLMKNDLSKYIKHHEKNGVVSYD